jgi:hypothetical protein
MPPKAPLATRSGAEADVSAPGFSPPAGGAPQPGLLTEPAHHSSCAPRNLRDTRGEETQTQALSAKCGVD